MFQFCIPKKRNLSISFFKESEKGRETQVMKNSEVVYAKCIFSCLLWKRNVYVFCLLNRKERA